MTPEQKLDLLVVMLRLSDHPQAKDEAEYLAGHARDSLLTDGVAPTLNLEVWTLDQFVEAIQAGRYP